MWAAAGLPRMKGLMEAARPAGAGLPGSRRSKSAAKVKSKPAAKKLGKRKR
jgi:hypothetical protein